MVLRPILCPHCHSHHVIKGGKTKAGQQRYKCQNTSCPHYSFQLDLLYKGRAPAIKEQIVDMKQHQRSSRQNCSLPSQLAARVARYTLSISSGHFVSNFPGAAMSLNGSGIRDTARVLKISPTTVINTLKKKSLGSLR